MYRIEKSTGDIIIDGWEEGIKDNPYEGIYDMRNCDVVTVPGEVSVAMSTQSTYTPTNISSVAFTVDAGTDVFTWAGTTTLIVGTAIRFTNSGGALPAGLSATIAYYIKTTPTPSTFTVSVAVGGTTKDVTDAGSGTNTFTAINMGTPKQIIKGYNGNVNSYFLYDSLGRIWVYSSAYFDSLNTWIYLNNLSSELSAGETGRIIFYKSYLFFIGTSGVGYNELNSIVDMTTKANWHLTWQSGIDTYAPNPIVSINDDSIYFCNDRKIGLIAEKAGTTFNPTNASTYTYNDNILPLPNIDSAICLAELGTNLMIGGINNYIYPWDRISPNFNSPIFLSENYITKMVTINTTMYIFAGYNGRIFVTNGSNATPFYKIPDYLSKTTNPYIVWKDATFNRNQLYFGFSCTTNSGTTINEYGGLWALNVDSVSMAAPRLQNQMSYGTYSGYVSALCQNRSLVINTPSSDGYGLWIGWYNGTIGGVDNGISTPYTGGQSYIDCDPLPLGTFLTPKTLENIQYKLGTPLVAGESVAFYWRKNIADSYTALPITQGNSTGDISGIAYSNFENSQWVQIRVVLTSIASSPSYCRLKEVRLH